MKTTLLAIMLLQAAYSQYPPGQYPPGQYPPGRQGPGIPMPRKSKSTTTRTEQTDKAYVIRGVVRSADAKSVESAAGGGALSEYKNRP